MKRQRKVNVDAMSEEQQQALADILSEEVNKTVKPAVDKVNRLFAVYGIRLKFTFDVVSDESGVAEPAVAAPVEVLKPE